LNAHPSHPAFSLEGKQVLITGASSGIGAATAALCALLGAQVLACGRDAARLDAVVAALAGGGHRAIAGDLTDPADRQLLIDTVPVLDGAVFCAGSATLVPFRMVSQKHMDAMFAVNFVAPTMLSQALLAKRKVANGGALVYVTAIAEKLAPQATAMYSAAKAALTAVARTIAIEHAKNGIRANCVSPDYVDTPMLTALQGGVSIENKLELTPLGTVGADEVAGAIAYLLAPASRRVSRTTLTIDGGISLHVR
jgi:NAD(P)-dependent dehydrogenase (short-subunit alcohol dehydrogenase family)